MYQWRTNPNLEISNFFSSAIGMKKRSILSLWINCLEKSSYVPPVWESVYLLERQWYVAKEGIFGWGNLSSTVSLEQTFICDLKRFQCGMFLFYWSRCILWKFNNENLLIYINGGFIGYCSGSNIINGRGKIVTI